MVRFLTYLTISCFLILLTSCASWRTGSISYSPQEGWIVHQPGGADDAARLEISDEKTVASTGSAKPHDQALAQLSFLPWLGALCVLGGVVTLLLRQWLPLAPANLSIGLMLLGVGLIAAPVFLDRYLHIVVIGGFVAALVVIGYLAYRVNVFKFRKGDNT